MLRRMSKIGPELYGRDAGDGLKPQNLRRGDAGSSPMGDGRAMDTKQFRQRGLAAGCLDRSCERA